MVEDFAAINNFLLLEKRIEIESGRKNNRPILKDALKACEDQNAVLFIARLNRLSHSVAFLSALMETKREFIAVDMPYANKFVLHIMIALAQFQAEETAKISRPINTQRSKLPVFITSHLPRRQWSIA